MLTVKDLAEKIGKTPQSIYKQLNGKLKPYVITENGKTYLDERVLDEVYGLPDPQEPERISDSTEELLRLYRDQIEQKDREIDRLHNLLENEQKLRAAADQRIALLENSQKAEETEVPSAPLEDSQKVFNDIKAQKPVEQPKSAIQRLRERLTRLF